MLSVAPERLDIISSLCLCGQRMYYTDSGIIGPRLSSELPPLSVSPLRFGPETAYATPPKNTQTARHSIFSSGSTVSNSTPTKAVQQASKRTSDKPKSFLSRVTSRPSLTFRYSSADLKSASKSSSRLFNKTPEKNTDLNTGSRSIVMVPVAEPVVRHLGEGRDFFTSPRAAPTPPSVTFTPSESLSQESIFDTFRPSASTGDESDMIRSTEDFRRRVKGRSPSVTRQTSLSPEVNQKSTPRSRHSHSVSSITVTSASDQSPNCNYVVPRSRNGVVRIGREEVTLSVANVLESELGVDVGDSEEESEYGEESRNPKFKSTSPKRFASLGPPPGILPILPDSSELPRLCSSSDDLNFRLSINNSQDILLESQSPLSALIAGAPVQSSPPPRASPYQQINRSPDHRISSPPAIERGGAEQENYSAAMLSHRQNKSFGGLDRISERSLQLGSDNSHSPRQSSGKKGARISDEQTVARLQQSLDTQCARFDRLARHLLEIIQRHTTEKLTLETRISTLERDVRARDREAKGLRWLVDNMKKASEEKRSSNRLGRASSMQSLTFGTSAPDKQADLSAIAAMLSVVARDDSAVLGDHHRKQEGRSSAEVSPDLAPSKEKSLRRAKTLPDMHGAGVGRGSGHGPAPPMPAQSPSPDISGVGLGLDFPLPEPLTLRSIASTLLSTAGSNTTVPSLTTAPTAASGLSMATLPSAGNVPSSISTASSPPKRNRLNSSEKRKAGEWHPGVVAHYRPSTEHSGNNIKSDLDAVPATYANNLNKGRAPNITHVLRKAESGQSLDFDSIFEKLVANAEEFLDQ